MSEKIYKTNIHGEEYIYSEHFWRDVEEFVETGGGYVPDTLYISDWRFDRGIDNEIQILLAHLFYQIEIKDQKIKELTAKLNKKKAPTSSSKVVNKETKDLQE